MDSYKNMEELWNEIVHHPNFEGAVISVARDGSPGEVEILFRYTRRESDGSYASHAEAIDDCMLDGALRGVCGVLGISVGREVRRS